MTIKEYKLKNGEKRYQFQVYVGIDPLTGKEKRTTRRGFKTKKQAELALARIKLEIEQGNFGKKTMETFREVYEEWFEVYKQSDVEESTLWTVEGLFNNHILPKFGQYKIAKIDLKFCQDAINDWSKNLVNYSQLKSYTSQVFQYARKHGLREDNPMELVDLPKKGAKKANMKREFYFYEKEELQRFLESVKNETYWKYAFFRLLAYSGIRKGEAIALTWADVNFNENTINIDKTIARGKNGLYVTNVKNGVSRVLDMDKATMAILKEWRTKQKQVYFQLGYNTLKPKQLVFSNLKNNHIDPGEVSRILTRIIIKYRLKDITVHGFRHTHCSLMFEAGATIKEVQERLGHTNSKTTMDIYTHVTKNSRSKAAEKFASFMES